tara:strand:- start:3 stop:452 length:450 start_codon:yes stop_codon:yes gene_type:complete
MKIKNPSKLKEEIIRDEGVVYAIYKDHLGYPTFGIGHLVKESDPEFGQEVDTPVSEERVDEVWNHDFTEHVEECGKLYPELESYPDEVQRVLVNMTFNMGMTRLSKFQNFKKAIESNDWKQAAVEGRDSRWYNQVTNRAERLMTMLEEV